MASFRARSCRHARMNEGPLTPPERPKADGRLSTQSLPFPVGKADANNGLAASAPIPLKKSAAGLFGLRSAADASGVVADQVGVGLAIGMILAIFRRFWAAAAR